MEAKKSNLIGILGGMGPEASADLYMQVIRVAQKKYGAVQDTDYPRMLIYNLPLEGFGETGILDRGIVEAQLVEGVKILEKAGCSGIVIACNTVHEFYYSMQGAISIPIFHVITEVLAALKEKEYSNVGVLSSRSTRDSGLYTDAFVSADLSVEIVDDSQQKLLDKVILQVMGARNQDKSKETMIQLINQQKEAGVDCVVLGCTELPIAVNQDDVDIVPLLSTTSVLANVVLRESGLYLK